MAFLEENGRMESVEDVAGDCFDDVLDNFPANVHTTLRYIKEIARKHTYDDIYAMLQECNMDPNEAVQKLLYVDPFHEVRHKHSKRRSNASTRVPERRRWMSGMQQRGAGGGRGNNYSAYTPNDVGRRRLATVRSQNGAPNHGVRNADVLVPVHRSAQDHAASHSNSSTAPSNGSRSVSNGSSIREHSQDSAADIRQLGERPVLPTVAVKQLSSSNPGPTPTPTPTIASIVSSGPRFDGRSSESPSTHLPNTDNSAPVSGVYSSASDPVLLPSLKLCNRGAVGTIGNHQCATEFSGQDGRNNSEEGVGTANGILAGVEKSKISESSMASSLLNHDNSSTAISKHDEWSLQQVNGPSKVMTTQVGTETQGANVKSISQCSDSILEGATSQLDMKLEKLKLSTYQPVIFPDHIQVPEALRTGLTFGSLNDVQGPGKNVNKDPISVDRTILINQDPAREPPLCHQTPASAGQEDDNAARSQTHPSALENLSALEMNALSAAAAVAAPPPKSDQLKPDILPHIGGAQYPFMPTAPDYSFGLVPPMLGPHLVQVEATEVGNSTVPLTSSSSPLATQPVGVGQTSLAVSPQLLPYLRQPFPSNYVPYNPYFPQLYMPHGSHQFLAHSGFPPQASTGNIYMPPAAATGVKYPVSSVYKPGTVATHFGIPSGYGSYGSSPVGYGLGATMAPSSSASNEDHAAPELKDKNIYSTLKQSDEPHMWMPAQARDMSPVPGNFFYNFPQGQQIAFSPAHSGPGPIAGMYHLTQTPGAPTSVQSLPQQSSQAMAGSAESMIRPSGTYQQTHSQIHWNTKLLNRENI